jgi:hypothetical protein
VNTRLTELELRQRVLRLRSESLRRQVAVRGAEVGRSVERVERGVAFARELTRWPVLVAAGGLLMLFAGPSRLLRWSSRGIVVAGLARRIGGLASQYARRPPP